MNIGNGWSVRLETITPETAKAMLLNNDRNRRLRPATVAKYAATMAAGNWRASPDGLIFGKSGQLLQGQHRLNAVINFGGEVDMIVWRGVEDDVFSVLDRGVTRSVADAIGADKKTTEVAAFIAKTCSRVQNGGGATDGDIARYVGVISDTHHELMEACNSSARVFSSAPMRAAAVSRIMSGYNRDYVVNVYRGLVLGHVSDIPPIAQSLVSWVLRGNTGVGAARQVDLFCRGWDVFDPSKYSVTKMQIKSHDRAINDLRRIMRAATA